MRNLVAAATGGLVAVTLMACYGAAPPGGYRPVNELPPAPTDADGDGFATSAEGQGADCDDSSSSIHPGADDPPGDGIDQNCDGVDGTAELGATNNKP